MFVDLLSDTEEEWEAELEGELNEFEVVSSKDGSPQNQGRTLKLF